jgi:ABC-type nitrate/sulfonate/bicarbonate transport system permease component
LLLIALPGVAQAWKAIALQSFGIALVVTVAAEMILSFSGSIGDEVAKMAWLLRMTDVYALVGWLFIWAVVVKYFVDQLPMVLEWPSRRIMEEVKRRTLLPD